MKKNIIKLLTIGLLSVILTTNVFAKKNKRIIIEGSTTVLPIIQKAAEVFMKKNPQADILVRGGGSGVGIASLLDKSCDIAMASRPMREREYQKAAGRGVEPKAHIISLDAIAVIVHPSNPINEISKKQLKDIYTGKISDWSKLGWDKRKIVVVSRDTASGTYEAFSSLALDSAKVRPDALVQASNQTIANLVATTPNAIGYVGIGYLTKDVKALKVDNVAPTKENTISKKYPLSRVLYLYTNGTPTGIIKEFIDFVLSKEGQKIVDEVGFVPLSE